MTRLSRIILLITLTLIVSACSSVGTYKAAQWWLSWKLNALVDLDREQKAFLSDSLEKHLNWHRESELDRYIAWIETVEARSWPASPKDIQNFMASGSQLYLDALDQILPDANALMRSFDDEQAEEFVASVGEKQEKYLGKYADLSAAELSEERTDRSLKSLKKYIGRPTDEQKQLIQQWADSVPPDPNLRERNAVWLAAFAENLKKRENADLFNRKNSELIKYPERVWSDATVAELQKRSDAVFELIAALDASLTEKQRDKLSKEIEERKRRLQRLAR